MNTIEYYRYNPHSTILVIVLDDENIKIDDQYLPEIQVDSSEILLGPETLPAQEWPLTGS